MESKVNTQGQSRMGLVALVLANPSSRRLALSSCRVGHRHTAAPRGESDTASVSSHVLVRCLQEILTLRSCAVRTMYFFRSQIPVLSGLGAHNAQGRGTWSRFQAACIPGVVGVRGLLGCRTFCDKTLVGSGSSSRGSATSVLEFWLGKNSAPRLKL